MFTIILIIQMISTLILIPIISNDNMALMNNKIHYFEYDMIELLNMNQHLRQL